MQTHDRLLSRLLGRAERAESEHVQAGLHLLDELERFEVEDKDLVLEHDHEHVLAQADVSDLASRIEGDLRAVLLLVVVPNDHLVLLACQHKHDDVRLVHHLDQAHALTKHLALFL